MAKQILVTGKKSDGLYAIVDDEMHESLSQHKWLLLKSSKNSSSAGYALARINGKMTPMHRLIMAEELKNSDSNIVDHIDRNTLNNQKSNLRVCSVGNNNLNSNSNSDRKTSKYKGVSKYRDGKWQVEITVNGKRFYLGRYEDEIEAAKVYDSAARFYFQDFGYTNLPGDISLSIEEIVSRHKNKMTTKKMVEFLKSIGYTVIPPTDKQ